jgi:hypothetical protein
MHESEMYNTWMGEDGICRTVVKEDAVIELEHALENSQLVRAACDGNIAPLFVDVREIRSISKQARDHFSMRNREPGITAIGMLIKSPSSKVIGNFFLGLNKPVVPTQLFTSEAKALKWLLTFVEKTN